MAQWMDPRFKLKKLGITRSLNPEILMDSDGWQWALPTELLLQGFYCSPLLCVKVNLQCKIVPLLLHCEQGSCRSQLSGIT